MSEMLAQVWADSVYDIICEDKSVYYPIGGEKAVYCSDGVDMLYVVVMR